MDGIGQGDADGADGELPDDAEAVFEAELDGDVVSVGDLVAVEDADGSAELPTLPVAAIGWAHRRAGRTPPHKIPEGGVAILDVLAGIRREHGKPPERKHAACGDVVRDVLRAIAGEDLRSVRDRALLAFGLASCLRRSELVALRLDDLARTCPRACACAAPRPTRRARVR